MTRLRPIAADPGIPAAPADEPGAIFECFLHQITQLFLVKTRRSEKNQEFYITAI
jgi:hypothetical protein